MPHAKRIAAISNSLSMPFWSGNFVWLSLAGAAIATAFGVAAANGEPAATEVSAVAFVIAVALASTALRIGWNRAVVWFAATIVPVGMFFAAHDPENVLGPVATAAALVTLLGGLFAALPPRGRRWLASLLILWHFGAVLVLVLSSPNPSWIVSQLHDRVYRPYHQFMHLRETYKWFSPEPGSEPILLFRLHYSDGQSKWIVLRRMEDFATNLEYLRFGSLTTWAFSTQPVGDDQLAQLTALRQDAGEQHDPPIPLAEGSAEEQYQEPSSIARLILRSYVRRIALVNTTWPHDANVADNAAGTQSVDTNDSALDPDKAEAKPADVSSAPAELLSIKVYAALRVAREPQEIVDHLDPLDRALLSVYYYGDYDPQGNLFPECLQYQVNSEGQVVFAHRDPFLYWLIPAARGEDGIWTDYLEAHAGDAPLWEKAW